jgi:hypothetical protein
MMFLSVRMQQDGSHMWLQQRPDLPPVLQALEADGLWKLVLLGAVAAAPIIWSRRIVEFKSC